MMDRGRWAAVAVAMAAGVVVTAIGSLPSRPTQEASGTGPIVPADDATVVAVLRTSDQPRSPDLVAALRATRAAPQDAETARAAARLLIDEGRSEGDSRLVGAALGVLRPVMDPPEAETLYLAATARQYQHDFTGAMDLLDRAIALDPRHVNALLTRATLLMVQGRIGEAQEQCQALAALRQDVGFLCQSTALIVTPQAPVVAERLAQIVAHPGLLSSSLEPWAMGLQGEIAMLQGNDAAARERFEALLARDPGSLRERVILADLLLRAGEPEAVTMLLVDAPDTDGVLLRRALAARALDAPDEAAEATLADRVRLNRELGLDAHAREDAMYHLLLAGDPGMALDRARANWALQHEFEDAQLLIDAAVAAGAPEEAEPVLDWMAQEGIDIPALRLPDGVRAAR
ncbi:MAG TPA: tetratricopeptide repeat protein [Rubellimicrobium sp.]|nr:tetratricopeptide repeat protein [Rubellimicrobium sp.]